MLVSNSKYIIRRTSLPKMMMILIYYVFQNYVCIYMGDSPNYFRQSRICSRDRVGIVHTRHFVVTGQRQS
jgi:hypothetical protein